MQEDIQHEKAEGFKPNGRQNEGRKNKGEQSHSALPEVGLFLAQMISVLGLVAIMFSLTLSFVLMSLGMVVYAASAHYACTLAHKARDNYKDRETFMQRLDGAFKPLTTLTVLWTVTLTLIVGIRYSVFLMHLNVFFLTQPFYGVAFRYLIIFSVTFFVVGQLAGLFHTSLMAHYKRLKMRHGQETKLTSFNATYVLSKVNMKTFIKALLLLGTLVSLYTTVELSTFTETVEQDALRAFILLMQADYFRVGSLIVLAYTAHMALTIASLLMRKQSIILVCLTQIGLTLVVFLSILIARTAVTPPYVVEQYPNVLRFLVLLSIVALVGLIVTLRTNEKTT